MIMIDHAETNINNNSNNASGYVSEISGEVHYGLRPTCERLENGRERRRCRAVANKRRASMEST